MALIAIGYTMVYGIIGMINFAHGDIYMIGAFIALIAFLVIGVVGVTWVPSRPRCWFWSSPWSSPRSMAGPWSAWPIGRCAARRDWRR